MTGFEAYSPLQWLVEGALSVHVSRPATNAVNAAFRRGKWVARGCLAAAAIAASVSSPAAVPTGATEVMAGRVVQLALDLPAPEVASPSSADRIERLKADIQAVRNRVRRGTFTANAESLSIAESASVAASSQLPKDWPDTLVRSLTAS